ncbi:MAG: hypothetical protein DA446_09655 [Bacteroidetes bacterium]|jgi:hypothetical protein|nr:MAG: hypothetical protein DA443_07280 [Bacteroidota bacterium]PTM17208.1 MAG: hypothetical protein DA446_09655 [Bacteroidota bacterium]
MIRFLFTLIVLFILSGISRVDASAAPAHIPIWASETGLKETGLNTLNTMLNTQDETLDWSVLANVQWQWKDNFYEATFNEQQQALDGKEVAIEGFMFPLEYTRKHQTFLVSASPMSNCFFCGPGEAESMVYVVADEAVEFTNRPVTVKGTFRLVSDASMGIIYQLDNAVMTK